MSGKLKEWQIKASEIDVRGGYFNWNTVILSGISMNGKILVQRAMLEPGVGKIQPSDIELCHSTVEL